MLDIKRHKKIFNPDHFHMPVTIFGTGGMGSRVAEGLARMGVGIIDKNPISLYDFDHFEPHNLPNQWASAHHLAEPKVVAVKSQILEINPEAKVFAYNMYAEFAGALSGVVFICFDSMSDRRDSVEKIVRDSPGVKCVIETRMDAGVGISHCFNPHNEKQLACWRMYWHSDDEAENMQGCSGHQSIISAIYGTTQMALKQFEQFARTRNTVNIANRIYYDFDGFDIRTESWPVA